MNSEASRLRESCVPAHRTVWESVSDSRVTTVERAEEADRRGDEKEGKEKGRRRSKTEEQREKEEKRDGKEVSEQSSAD